MSILRAENITKDYPGTRALDNISASFQSGKINALLGKNGSGKSTLVKVFAGAEKQTSGSIYLGGKKLEFKTPIDAAKEGIFIVYQETSLVSTLSVTENVFMGRLPLKRNGLVDWKAAKIRTAELLAKMGVNINPNEKILHLPMWKRQVVEICKALSNDPKVLILDEPTSALAQNEVQNLFKAVKKIKENDVVIIYITHKLSEVHLIADTVTAIRDGVLTGVADIEDADNAKIIYMMFGDVEFKKRPVDSAPSGEICMEVRNLSRKGWYKDISFKLYRGEVLGIAGLLGSGRTELLRGIFGADPVDSGEVVIGNTIYRKHGPMIMKEAGVGLTPEDRKTTGLILQHSIQSNLCYAGMKKTTTNGWIESAAKRKEMADRQVRALKIKLSSINARASSLSGGNQQKVVVGNWLNNNPKIMIYDEPTRGIDITAKQQIFEIMWNQSKEGNSSIFVSTEIEELLDVCHRILVISHGRLIKELDAKALETLTVSDLFTLCMGDSLNESENQ
ncbi:MAG: sugar ABC transporter ATP-binding protein [Spirochaetes bacterium]|nr:sugar ABC transporter ATP-binding protein [Spirochaetota bacterium]